MKTLALFLTLASVAVAQTYTIRLRHATAVGAELGSVRLVSAAQSYQAMNELYEEGAVLVVSNQPFNGSDIIASVPVALGAFNVRWYDINGGLLLQSYGTFGSPQPAGAAKELYFLETGSTRATDDRGEYPSPEDPGTGGGGSAGSLVVNVQSELDIEMQLRMFFLGFGCALPMLAVSYTITMARRARQLDGGAS